MAKRARVEGLERLKAKIARLPPTAKKNMTDLNQDSARRMRNAAMVRLDRGDPQRGHLEDTLRVEKGQTETGFLVRVGGQGQPYPLHLEAGHKAPDGSHVAPRPFWYPAKRETLKRHKAQMKHVLDETVAEIVK